jgi:hypothetical protein
MIAVDGRKINPKRTGTMFHSHSYHRFFEGYEESYELRPDGKTRIRRVYTGNHYAEQGSRKKQILTRTLQSLLTAAALLLFLTAGNLTCGANKAWYVNIPQALSIIFLFFVVIGLFCSWTSGGHMEIRSYRGSHERIEWSSRALTWALAAAGFGSLLYLIFHLSSTGSFLALLDAGMTFAASLSVYAVMRLEKNKEFEVLT